MSRPRQNRWVEEEPDVTYFKPAGIPKRELQEIIVTVDEFEAVRLKDFLGLDQIEAAAKMNISQPTFHRLLLSARQKISDAIVNGKAIKIQGGNYTMNNSARSGSIKGRGFGKPAGSCRCPSCGHEARKQRGNPCSTKTCPKCGKIMMRGE